MHFWNENIPNLIRHRPRGPRPQILDRADGIGKYRNNNSSKTPLGVNIKYTTDVPNNLDSGSAATNVQIGPKIDTNAKQNNNDLTTDEGILKESSTITMVIGFGVVFLLINLTAFLYFYHRRLIVKKKEKSAALKPKRGYSKKSDGKGNAKTDGRGENLPVLNHKSDSKPDINEVVKNDKAYDNNSNFGRQSKLSRHNSSSTIDTHIKVKEWIQQEIVHR